MSAFKESFRGLSNNFTDSEKLTESDIVKVLQALGYSLRCDVKCIGDVGTGHRPTPFAEFGDVELHHWLLTCSYTVLG